MGKKVKAIVATQNQTKIESRVDWLGRIPNHWKLMKGKYLFQPRNEKGNTNQLQLLSPTQKYGEIPQDLYDEISGMKAVKLKSETDYSQLKSIYKGDYCISLRSFQGGFEYSQYDGVVSPAYQVFYKRENVFDAYYRFLFKDQSFISKMNSLTKSFRDGKIIAFTDFGNNFLPVPPIDEQIIIANYLDRKCSHIDSVIEKTRESIEEYKKLKQSIITEAVTKGIRPNRKMKDSRVSWIDVIPDEWKTSRIKSLFIFGKGLPITKENLLENGVSVISYGQIHSKANSGVSLQEELFRFVSEDYLTTNPTSLVKRTDFIFADTSEDREGCGNCVYVDSDMVLFAGYHTIVFSSKDKTDKKYLAYLFKTDAWRSQIREKVSGVKLFSISRKILNDATVLLPGDKEQHEIVEYLDEKCSEMDSLIAQKEQLITELDKFKKSIIYEYVTGKKELQV